MVWCGAYEQPKKIGDRPDPFAFTKAIHKAQRNAIKQLIPVPVIQEVLNFYLHRKVKTDDAEQQPQAEQTNGSITNAQKAAFATASELTPQLEKVGHTKDALWVYVKRHYNVESRNDMTEKQWTQLAAELNAAKNTPKLLEELITRIGKVTATQWKVPLRKFVKG